MKKKETTPHRNASQKHPLERLLRHDLDRTDRLFVESVIAVSEKYRWDRKTIDASAQIVRIVLRIESNETQDGRDPTVLTHSLGHLPEMCADKSAR